MLFCFKGGFGEQQDFEFILPGGGGAQKIELKLPAGIAPVSPPSCKSLSHLLQLALLGP